MILIIAPQKRLGKDLESIFRLRGMITKMVQPIEALHHIKSSVSAILLLFPESLPDKDEYLKHIKLMKYNIPLFALTRAQNEAERIDIFADVIDANQIPANILDIIHHSQERLMCRLSGIYRLYGIDASITNPEVTFHKEPISLTKTETAILRYLICNYPNPCPSEKIAKAIYPTQHTPQPSCIRAHICAINKKLRPYASSALIVSMRGEGYQFNGETLIKN